MTTNADAPAPAPETPTTAAAQPPVAPAPAPVATPAPPADPVAAERTRCAGIHAAMLPGFAKLAAMAVEAGWPVAQFTAAQAASADAVETARRDGAGASFRESLPAPLAGGGGAPDAPTDPVEKAKADFAASDALKAEFGNEGRYLAYLQAVSDGKVRVIAPKRA